MADTRFRIIGDSSLDTDPALHTLLGNMNAPLHITIDGHEYIDDESLDIDAFHEAMRRSDDVPRSAAPAPGDFLACMEGVEEGVFIITLTSKLSGSYNSAAVAQELAAAQYPNLKVHVIDSLAASAGQTAIALKIHECIEAGMGFEQIASEADAFRDSLKLFFLLDSLDTLAKNGRMGKLKGLIAIKLHIKPVLGSDGHGEIRLINKATTIEKGLVKLASEFIEARVDPSQRTLIIAECEAHDRAQKLKELVSAQRTFKDVIIVPMRGLSSTYACLGGLVCAC